MNDVSQANNRNYKITAVIYALQAMGIFVGITFLFAIIMNYIKRSDVANTWLASHFTWQIRTFWYSLLWPLLAFMSFFGIVGGLKLLALIFPHSNFTVLRITLMGLFTLFVIGVCAVISVWIIYRIAKGAISLYDKKPMYFNIT